MYVVVLVDVLDAKKDALDQSSAILLLHVLPQLLLPLLEITESSTWGVFDSHEEVVLEFFHVFVLYDVLVFRDLVQHLRLVPESSGTLL